MSKPVGDHGIASPAEQRTPARGGLYRKYVALITGVVCAASLAVGLISVWFSYQDHKSSLVQIQHEQAASASARIGHFVREIESQLGWLNQLPWSTLTLDERSFDALRLFRQMPAITELTVLDNAAREKLRVSRREVDVIGSGIDRSSEPLVVQARANKAAYGSVYFYRDSVPYMKVALAGQRGDEGISIASVNLSFIWDVVSNIKVGKNGGAYVIDSEGRLIAHPDISLVLRNIDLRHLPQVQAARTGVKSAPIPTLAQNVRGQAVLTAYARVEPLDWHVFVELPAGEAWADLNASLLAIGLVLLGALALGIFASLILARSMVTPIRELETGAALIGTGALDHRIDIRTGDELQALGDQFNSMAAQLQDYLANLERKVDERTHQLELANLSKSRFLAAASHDLRQPLHALNLFIVQLRGEADEVEKKHVVARIDAAIATMNELFNALLDISKLDAGVLTPGITKFPVAQLLRRIETTFVVTARAKGLRLRVIASSAWVASDFILLERILLNLVSNAVKYTVEGGIVVGCRRRGDTLRIEVWDTGIGIPEDQQRDIFGEFYQLPSEHDGNGGLGLGLAIVDRLCRLLEHPIKLESHLGRGSRFAVSVPAVAQAQSDVDSLPVSFDQATGKVIVVIDDDQLVLDGMEGLLKSWGCSVVTASSDDAALAALPGHHAPDLIISDYRLANGVTGIEVIQRIRRAFAAPIPAFLISGDTAPERLRDASASGYHLLHKPVLPLTLRATVNSVLKGQEDAIPDSETTALRGAPTALKTAAAPSPMSLRQ